MGELASLGEGDIDEVDVWRRKCSLRLSMCI
jgi:hypothetical protein